MKKEKRLMERVSNIKEILDTRIDAEIIKVKIEPRPIDSFLFIYNLYIKTYSDFVNDRINNTDFWEKQGRKYTWYIRDFLFFDKEKKQYYFDNKPLSFCNKTEKRYVDISLTKEIKKHIKLFSAYAKYLHISNIKSEESDEKKEMYTKELIFMYIFNNPVCLEKSDIVIAKEIYNKI